MIIRYFEERRRKVPRGRAADGRRLINDDVSVGRTVWMVGCLVAAAVLQLVGMFLPLYHLHIPRQGYIPARVISISSYSATPYARLQRGESPFLMMLCYFAARRRDRIAAAIASGTAR